MNIHMHFALIKKDFKLILHPSINRHLPHNRGGCPNIHQKYARTFLGYKWQWNSNQVTVALLFSYDMRRSQCENSPSHTDNFSHYYYKPKNDSSWIFLRCVLLELLILQYVKYTQFLANEILKCQQHKIW